MVGGGGNAPPPSSNRSSKKHRNADCNPLQPCECHHFVFIAHVSVAWSPSLNHPAIKYLNPMIWSSHPGLVVHKVPSGIAKSHPEWDNWCIPRHRRHTLGMKWRSWVEISFRSRYCLKMILSLNSFQKQSMNSCLNEVLKPFFFIIKNVRHWPGAHTALVDTLMAWWRRS